MGLAQYQIVSQGDEWGVLHDGDVKNRYVTRSRLRSGRGRRLACDS